jgi:hypothetical protein
MRIPMIVRYPKKLAGGKVRDEMVLNIDLAPTILEYAGVGVPKGNARKELERASGKRRATINVAYFFLLQLFLRASIQGSLGQRCSHRNGKAYPISEPSRMVRAF